MSNGINSSGPLAGDKKLYKKIDKEYFIDQLQTKFQLRHFHMINIADLDIILISTF
jgi:hypothetical protein